MFLPNPYFLPKLSVQVSDKTEFGDESMKQFFIAMIGGLIFGAGLAVSGMTDTNKVIGFLDVFGAWDISLLLVMVAGLCITIPAYQLSKRLKKPFFSSEFSLPSMGNIDGKLLTGTALFGIGWGLYGYCPGPAIASLAQLNWETFLFVFAMITPALIVNNAGIKEAYRLSDIPSYIQWISSLYSTTVNFSLILGIISLFLFIFISINSHYGNFWIFWGGIKKSVAFIVKDSSAGVWFPSTNIMCFLLLVMSFLFVIFGMHGLFLTLNQ